ncbi:type II secretion system minor pseudopilin GspI [Erwinia tasmaniensis]|uniref:Type II secretion system protein I n=1 Tax=Erwinia tasmaniensis (strain DSM 17950 / CFBP 7177 / CIP 109463 / NCPPB 4357 / Et1/99) TaxID=465817 RepID=B2VI03_ERWT9|nr:type II secretion system minor pseudopilin GspI [Erwinia tasmaniensis]CAO95833.1 General secretion pathway protein I [Erwinia tasmaniensis Et1/99]
MKQRGMTLLEVMVALAILAIAGLALMKTTGEQVRNLTLLEQKQFAYWVADNQLAERYLERTWPAQQWLYGTSVMAEQRWFWRWRGVSTSDPKIRALEIEVRSDKNSQHAIATLHSWQVKE